MPAKSKNAIIFEVRFQISLLAYVDYQTFICIISSLWNIPLLTEFVVCIVNYRPSFSALIFVLVMWDAGSKKLHKFFQSCLFQICLFVCLFANHFSFHDGLRRSLICVGMWKWPWTSVQGTKLKKRPSASNFWVCGPEVCNKLLYHNSILSWSR